MQFRKYLILIMVLIGGILLNNVSVYANYDISDAWMKDNLYVKFIEDYLKNDNSENILQSKIQNGRDRIHFLPVLGDSILLESNGLFALIDGGEDSDNPKGLPTLDYPGYEQLVIDYIKSVAGDENGKVTLEFVIGTHAHSDHLGGLDSVILDPDIEVKRGYLKRYNEERISDFEVVNWDNQEVYDQMMAALEEVGAEIIQDLTMDPFPLGEMVIQLFNVEEDDTFPIVKKGENENSLGVKVTIENYSAFLAGDMNNCDGDEERLAPLIGEVNLLKLGHHGLEGSSSSIFLNTLRPQYAIVSGYTKNFYTPTREVLKSIGASSYSTMTNNGVIFDFSFDNFGLKDYQEIFIGWNNTNNHSYYYNQNGEMIRGWYLIEDNWYFFDEEIGTMLVGWIEHKGDKYYTNKEGVMQAGWEQVDGTWYYFNQSGKMQTGWLQEGSTWYYLKSNGAMATGWEQVDGTWYYFNQSGKMQTGWLQEGSTWYYLKSNGVMATGWEQVNRTWYYFNQSGKMQTGWLQEGSTWYYLKSNGGMATGWEQVNETWYYFNQSGKMQTGWLQEGSTWYYLKSNGAMATGWEQVNGTWYYFHQSGKMATNTIIDGWKVKECGAAYKL